MKKKFQSSAMVTSKSEPVALVEQKAAVSSEEHVDVKPSNNDEHTEVQPEPSTMKSSNTGKQTTLRSNITG